MTHTKKPKADGRPLTEKVKSAKGRKLSSTKWLQRQLNDPYVQEAKRLGLRGRAAFKLSQIDDKFKLLKPGSRVIDLGAAPGGWSQVAVERVSKVRRGIEPGVVVGLDLKAIEPLAGAIFLQGDFMSEEGPEMIRAAMGGPADLVLSDMAPDATGHAATDHLRIIAMAEAAVQLAREILVPGGSIITKVLQGTDEPALFEIIRQNFSNIRRYKPAASRTDSAELFLIGLNFRAPE
jgi:23S rRNA (uridine2552-2'-O)-methyltransferase